MSAPPIGMISRKPSARARKAINQNSSGSPVTTKIATSSSSNAPSAAFNGCCILKMIGAPLIRPSSLAKAINEPEKVTAPIARPSDISTKLVA